MNKTILPAILAATILIAGIFAFMPVEKASTLHTSTTGATGTTTTTATTTQNALFTRTDFTTWDTTPSGLNDMNMYCASTKSGVVYITIVNNHATLDQQARISFVASTASTYTVTDVLYPYVKAKSTLNLVHAMNSAQNDDDMVIMVNDKAGTTLVDSDQLSGWMSIQTQEDAKFSLRNANSNAYGSSQTTNDSALVAGCGHNHTLGLASFDP